MSLNGIRIRFRSDIAPQALHVVLGRASLTAGCILICGYLRVICVHPCKRVFPARIRFSYCPSPNAYRPFFRFTASHIVLY
jgi:hypothetical protein